MHTQFPILYINRMKKNLLSILCMITVFVAQAQINSVSLDFFPPIVTPGMLQFYNTSNVLKQANSHSRDYTALGSSATMRYAYKSLLLGYRIGMVYRTIKESNMGIIENEDDEGNVVETLKVYSSYSYNQKHIVQTISCAKQQTFDNLIIGIQTEIPLILYGKGHAEHSINNDYSTNTSTQIQTIGSGFASGIGVGIQLTYTVTQHIGIGLGFSEYLLYMNFTNPSTIIYTDTYYNIQNRTITNDTKLTQLQFSDISPSFSISYLFNTSTKALLSR